MASKLLSWKILIPFGGLTGAYLHAVLPHILNLERKRKMLQFYKEKDSPLFLSDFLVKIRDEVMRDIDIPEERKKNITFFMATVSDPVNFGTTTGKEGGYVGLPPHFLFENEAKMMEHNIEPAKFPHILLSRDAIKFAIAEEVEQLDHTWSHHIVGLLRVLSFGTGVGIYVGMAKYIIMKTRTQALLLLLVCTIYSFFCNKSLLSFYNRRLEYQIDNKVGRMSKAYAEGGLEYIKKLLTKNLHEVLNNKYGALVYKDNGDWKSSIPRPLTVRKSHLIEIVQSFSSLDKKLEK